MLDLFWQRLFPGHRMTRIQEPDLLIDHDSGGGGGGGGGAGSGCKHFLEGGPVLEPFAYSGVVGAQKKAGSGGPLRKWFSGIPAASKTFPKGKSSPESCRHAFSSSPSSASSPLSPSSISDGSSPSITENPIVVVHNNNNNVSNNYNNFIVEMSDENTRWSSQQHDAAPFSCGNNNNKISASAIPPPTVVTPPHIGLVGKATKIRHSASNKSSSKINNNNLNSNKNNCTSNNSSSSSPANKCPPSRMNNCAATPSITTTVNSSHINSSNSHHNNHHQMDNGGSSSEDEDSGARHLIIRYIQCNERPNKRQLVTLGLISVVFLIILVILLALFLSPARTLNSPGGVSPSSSEVSDAFVSSDITSGLNSDDVDLDDSDSYDDGDMSYYSSTTSSSSSSSGGGGGSGSSVSNSNSNTNLGLDLKKVSKLSWDLLNSNQDASSRGSTGSSSSSGSKSGGGGGSGGPGLSASSSPLGGVSSSGGEIILPAKMIYTSSGDSSDLMPSENGSAPGSQNKKRSCCRTQKYSQVIKRDGCEPLTIVNKMCFGQCVSVWVPGLFASFPVCRPSKSTFKTVTLTCGRNKEKRKRVRIEKVRRCSCMEIEPTAASL